MRTLNVFFSFVLLLSWPAAAAEPGAAPPSRTVSVDLLRPHEAPEVVLSVSRLESARFGWLPGRRITFRATVERANGRLEPLADAEGRRAWTSLLGADGSAQVRFRPAVTSFSGELVVTADGRPVRSLSLFKKTLSYRFEDGARIRVHFTDQVLERAGEDGYFARRVLDAAVQAYQTITEFQGFSAAGHSFADPDPAYAHDPDRTIDIYLGDPKTDEPFDGPAFEGLSFRDAPCFDTRSAGGTAHDAVILLPANYREFIKSWERINPSSLGSRNVEVDLRGTLMHEMLHVVLFYYNKNLNKEGEGSTAGRRVDWYVEGLARYFETFAGARHDFFSQGFKQTLPDKVRFSRGGSNYFMRYPDQAFTELRYENALFWRFVHNRFGMERIEELSRRLRGAEPGSFRTLLEDVTGTPFETLLKDFATALLWKEFGLKGDAEYLHEIARTRTVWDGRAFVLVDGMGGRRLLGTVCRTDWIGRWEQAGALFGEPGAAGDSSERSDVSGWATDFHEIAVEGSLPRLAVRHEGESGSLAPQVVLVTRGGARLAKDLGAVAPGREAVVDLAAWTASNGLSDADVRTVFVLVTNTHPSETVPYALEGRPA